MAIYDKASLVLIPSGTKTSKVYSQKPTNGDGDFTFSRSTAATRVNASGNIEKETQNLLLQSNTFDTTWGNNNTTETGNQSGYDGSSDAWLVSSTASFGSITQGFSAVSGVYSLSIYAKAGTNNWLLLRMLGSSSSRAWFDLANGVIGSSDGPTIESKIESVGGGWYRCSVTGNMSSFGQVLLYPTNADLVVGAAGSIYIQDAQLEQGLVARDYIETTTTAIYGGITDNVPRLDYTDSSCPALLLEPQRTNIVEHSEYTDGTNWSNEGSIVDEENTSETTSPEGYYNAVKLVSANATSEQWIQASGLNVTSTGYYTASCFVKKSDYDFFYIRFTGVGGVWGAGGAWFNINTGSVATTQSGVTADIVDYGNGWYRVSATKEAVATAFGAIRFQLASSDGSSSVVGDGSKGTYVYGFQVEAGSYATSYIPTYGSAVTRGADDCENTSASSLIGQTEGTLFAEVYIDTTGDFRHIINAKDTSNTERMLVYLRTTNRLRFQYPSSLYDDVTITSGWYKLAVSWNGSNISFFRNGTKLATKTNLSKSVTFSELTLGNYLSGDQLGNNMKQAISFTTALTDAECIALTTI